MNDSTTNHDHHCKYASALDALERELQEMCAIANRESQDASRLGRCDDALAYCSEAGGISMALIALRECIARLDSTADGEVTA